MSVSLKEAREKAKQLLRGEEALMEVVKDLRRRINALERETIELLAELQDAAKTSQV